jgi:uncharacterized membrane protein YsdA (DUF1294 family)
MKSAMLANLPTHLILIVASYYLAASLLAFLLIGRDKRAAVSGRRRTAELRLHLLSMVGGWPGTWLACRVFRHKTQKLSFQRRLGIMIALNFMLLAGISILINQWMRIG